MRNPNWFIEESDSFYRQVGELITKGQRTPAQKLLAIGNWLQNKLDYIPEEYAEIMHNLKLSNPKMMDVAVPANKKGVTLKDLNFNK